MRRNDFFKYLLFSGGNPASRVELETETLPYTFYTQPKTLKNYRIYGNTVNGESVGEKTANCFDKNDLTQLFGPGYNLIDSSQNWNKYTGVAYTIRIPCKPSTTYTLTIQSKTTVFRLATVSTNQIPSLDSAVSCTSITDTTNARKHTFTTPNNAMFILFQPGVNDLEMIINTLMLAESSVEVDYEPYGYKIPVIVNEQTTNIYLDEPLAKSNDIADYIDYKLQKRFNIDGTSEDVFLPEIAVFDNENEISFGTTIQPSKVYLKGSISENEVTVSRQIQPLRTMRSLQPLSLDNDLQLDVIPSDRHVFDLNGISETALETDIHENGDIGGNENSE